MPIFMLLKHCVAVKFQKVRVQTEFSINYQIYFYKLYYNMQSYYGVMKRFKQCDLSQKSISYR